MGDNTPAASSSHALTRALLDAAHGRFPQNDGELEVLPAIDGVAAVIVAFSGHNLIATTVEPDEVRAHLPSDDPGAPMHPAFLTWLSTRLGASQYTPDLVMSTFRTDPDLDFPLVERDDLRSHPRALIAQRYRQDVRVYSDTEDRGVLTFGRSLAGNLEVSIEVRPGERGRGVGRRLAFAARALLQTDEPLFAAVSPGNAASVRAFLAAGYRPICSEVGMIEGGVREARARV